MFLVSILTSEFVYRFLKKKENKENKVGSSSDLTNDSIVTQLESDLTISNAVIELRSRFLTAIGGYEKYQENETPEKNDLSDLTFESNEEKLKGFILKNNRKNGNLPSEKEMILGTGLSDTQIRRAKEKLISNGFLIRINSRVLKVNPQKNKLMEKAK
jgi:hypothetical protein